MNTNDLILDLVHNAKALKAAVTLFSETFTDGTMDQQVLAIQSQPDTYVYAMYNIESLIDDINKAAEALETATGA